MKSLAEELRAKRTSPKAVWLRFVQVRKPNSKDVYLFVEGRDDVSFYLMMLRQICPDVCVRDFDCGNKDNVLALSQTIRTRHGTDNCLFCVDKDHDDFLGKTVDGFVYVTSTYSIENLLATKEVLWAVWREYCGLACDDGKYEDAERRFVSSQKAFWKRMTPLMAWLILHRKMGTKININNVDWGRLFDIEESTLDLVRAGKIFSLLRSMTNTSCARQPSIGELISLSRAISKMDPKAYVRGKQELWHFVLFVNRLMASMSKSVSKGERNKKPLMSAMPSQQNAVQLLASRISPPSDFVAYVRKMGVVI